MRIFMSKFLNYVVSEEGNYFEVDTYADLKNFKKEIFEIINKIHTTVNLKKRFNKIFSLYGDEMNVFSVTTMLKSLIQAAMDEAFETKDPGAVTEAFVMSSALEYIISNPAPTQEGLEKYLPFNFKYAPIRIIR